MSRKAPEESPRTKAPEAGTLVGEIAPGNYLAELRAVCGNLSTTESGEIPVLLALNTERSARVEYEMLREHFEKVYGTVTTEVSESSKS